MQFAVDCVPGADVYTQHRLCTAYGLCGCGWMCSDLNCLCIDQNGLTALMIAGLRGHHECLCILLAHGAEVDKSSEVRAVIGSIAHIIFVFFCSGVAVNIFLALIRESTQLS